MRRKTDAAQHPPRISLICVVLNVAKYIESTIKSVRAQTCGDWELIIIDGTSTDGTQEIVQKYTKIDPRIIFKSEPDEGPWDATEKGMAMARGEFIMIVAGQDGFLDNEWLAKCLRILDKDNTISLVWASTRGMHDDGVLFPEKHVSYYHLTHGEGTFDITRNILQKIFQVGRDLIFGSSIRRKILIKKLFSKTAILKMNFFTRRMFPGDVSPQREDWFRYWLDTAVPFSEQPMCVAKRVYLDCVSRYPRGSRIVMDHIMDFHYNFNAKGYLAYYVPTLAGYGRNHPDNSGARLPEELYSATEKYLQKVLALRKKYLDDHEEMVFIDRVGNEVSRRRF